MIKDGLGRVVHVALGTGCLAQGGELLFAHLVILELCGIDKLLELVKDLVGDHEVGRSGDIMVLCDIACGEVKVPMVAHDVIDDALELPRLDFDVGVDAAALAHLTTMNGVENARCAVGGGLLVGAVGIAVAIVHLLDEASAGAPVPCQRNVSR